MGNIRTAPSWWSNPCAIQRKHINMSEGSPTANHCKIYTATSLAAKPATISFLAPVGSTALKGSDLARCGCLFHCRLWHCSRFFCKAWWFIWQSKLRTNALVNLMSLEQCTQRDIPFHIHYTCISFYLWPGFGHSSLAVKILPLGHIAYHEHALYMGYNLLPRPIPKRRTKSLHALAYLEPQRRLSGPVRGSGLQEQLACHVEIARTDSTHQT